MPVDVAAFERTEAARIAVAMVDGKHYTAFVEEVKALRRAGDHDAAAGLLLRLIDAVERESRIPLAGHVGVPRWYFDQLAAIYAKEGMERERAQLMQRYFLLQADAERSGHLALLQIRHDAAVPAAGESPRPPNRRVQRAAFALGRMIARLLRWR